MILMNDAERFARYGKELDLLAHAMQALHPTGEVKGIGRLEVVQALREWLEDVERGRIHGNVKLAALRLHDVPMFDYGNSDQTKGCSDE